ncbi:MAG TPA: hypothetical protein VGQ57_16015 [Polyangiaceae bacterium]|jgi:hypothetical protein|nr:hypothetical protein [Polyangiaceae bacterium]
MNFFGHAAIAGQFREDPVFVLGAMLPDFWGMLGLRAPEPTSGPLGAGVRFHHVTDGAFHELDAFRAFCRDGAALLDARGVRRGTARAVAHVGVELFLDAELAGNPAARELYFEALRAGQQREHFAQTTLLPADSARLEGLARALEMRGVAEKPDTELLVTRLERALAARPRLAIEPRDRDAVTEWVELFRPRVVASAPRIVSELTSAIERTLVT